MKKITLLFILSLTITSISYSQSKFGKKKIVKDVISYSISGHIKNLESNQDTLILAAYVAGFKGTQTFAKDTALVVNDRFTFKNDTPLEEGMYFIFDPQTGSMILPLFVTNQNFSFSFDIKDFDNTIKFQNSIDNTIATEYQVFIQSKVEDRNKLSIKLDSLDNNEREIIEREISTINTSVKEYTQQLIKNHSKTFFSKFLKANQQIEIPESPIDSTGNPDKTFPYRFYKKHFWDNIDFSDARMLRTPIFFNKMDQYLDKLTAKHPDSINVSADVLVNLSKANGDIFQYVVSYITSTYERSKIMGMDAVFVHMVENYYITKQCDWVDSTQLVKISDRAQKIAPNLIGRKASEFLDFYGRPFMKDTLGKLHTLQEVEADYTLLVFYGPTCGHCKKEIPKIKHALDSLVETGINIKPFSVATEFDKAEWKKFINAQKIGDWINVADINHDEDGNPVASSDWRDKYDIYSTPVIYLLDKEKKIIAKRISYKQIAEIVGRLEENN
ncbi:MAG: thiol-disulfide isomerase/thioredoxin [Thalassomonas sp.]|jgi:thiol-disulfide isomerase/thioredoxin